MITANEAQNIILKQCEGTLPDGTIEKFAIMSCELSPCKNYWVIRCNSEDYVLRNIVLRMYIGVNAHLVHVQSGQVETIGSAESVDGYLQDKLDYAHAEGKEYVLIPLFDKTDKKLLIHFKQWLQCGISDAINMVSDKNKLWLTGTKRDLQRLCSLLNQEQIPTGIILSENPANAVQVDRTTMFVGDVKNALIQYLNRINC